MNAHPHHPHPHDYDQSSGIRGWLTQLFRPHSHDHTDLAADHAFADNQAGIRTVWLALAALTITSILQIGVVYMSGSVSLFADTAHNIGDGLNSIPLLIAFYLARRLPTSRYTYGFGRAEDVAGLFIVLSIAISAGIVLWESFQRLLNPQPLTNLGWVAAAALIGFLGNEAVAFMQIRVGRRIGSAALVADGMHARTDGLTSLAVLVAAGGAWLGFPLIDPIIGLLIGLAILVIAWGAARTMWYRLLDAIEPELMDKAEIVISQQSGVEALQKLQMRWLGHRLRAEMVIAVAPEITAVQTQEVTQALRHQLRQQLPKLSDVLIETAPFLGVK